jgi:HlyD family secretion protein
MSGLATLWRLLTPAQRRRCLHMQLLSLAMALSTVVGLAALMPFFAVLADASLATRHPALASFVAWSGITDPGELRVVLGAGFIGLLMAANAINLLGHVAMARFTYRIGDEFRVALFDEYLHRDYPFHLRHGANRLAANVLYEADRITGVLQSAFVLSTNTLMIPLICVSIAIVDPGLAAVVLPLFAGGYGFVYLVARRRLLENGRIQTQAGGARVAAVEQGLRAVRDLLLTRRQSHFRKRFAEASATISRVATSTQLIGHYPRHLLECIAGIGLVVAALVLSARTSSVGTWLAELTFIGVAAYRLLPAVQQAYYALVTVRAHRGAIESLAGDLASALARRSDGEAVAPTRARRASLIEFHDVSFRYAPDAPLVLDSVSLRIEAGTAIGLVGPNGSGKSTLADLLSGLLSPESGRIEIDGKPLDEANLREWRTRVGYVPQDIFLVDSSVRENIAFGCPPEKVHDARVREAARLAGASGFIEALPRGFDETLGERGARLSGGQRQLIGIARALYGDPDLLVLDEGTSALDLVAEAAIVETVMRLRGARTVLVIAHRAATVEACDHVYELIAGRLSVARPAMTKAAV